MANYGFHFNSEWCVGCRCCQISCKEKKGLGIGILYRKLRDFETDAFPNPGYYHISSTCNHCVMPACFAVCPVSAITKDADTGVVTIDTEVCIGCKECVTACPYSVPQFFDELNVANKCDFCQDLLAEGENPICVDACPQFALDWGDIDELKPKYPEAVVDIPALPDSSQTSPSYIITPRASTLKVSFIEKPI
jgi:anaerobic dimethyl sulfoxide reductase subunit B (iron-sulfur subunit)